jgi:hypothetical protein
MASQLDGQRVWTLRCMGLFLDWLYWQNEIPFIFLFSCHEGPSTPQPLSLSGTSMASLLACHCVMTLCMGLFSLLNCTGKTKSLLHPSVQFFLTARGALNPTV